MHKGVKIVLMTLLWVFVVAFVVFFNGRARHHRANTTVHSLRISILDSLRDEMLVTSDAVERWIAHSKIPTLGVPVGEIDLDAIEQCIRGNGFIDRVSAYVTYGGELRVEVSQRRPLLRLMVDGYDCYVTGEGFVFPAPRLASVYVPVVTGSYRPPVPKGYVGRVEDYIAEQIAKSQAQADTLQYEKVPLFKATQDIADSVRSVRRMQVERKGWLGGFKGPFETYAEYDARVEAKRAEKARLRRNLRYLNRENDKKIAAVTARQQAEVEKQKKLQKRYEDFLKLINFVGWIEDEPFWSAEIVQIVAKTTASGALKLELVPRSGDHIIEFGRIENVEEKLDKLMRFYKEGLRNKGWDNYSVINIEYDGQVVCSK